MGNYCKIIKTLLTTFFLSCLSVQAETTLGIFNINFSPAEDGSITTVAFTHTGNNTLRAFNFGVPVPLAGINIFDSSDSLSAIPWHNLPSLNFIVSPFGTIRNETTGISANLNQLVFSYNPSRLDIYLSEFLSTNGNDLLAFSFISSPVIIEIEVPFAQFNHGFYAGEVGNQQFNMEIVPEPSSLSLLLAGGAVLIAGRRKCGGRL